MAKIKKDTTRYSKRERNEIIKVYAMHYHSPISNFRDFSKTLYENTGIRTTKNKVLKLLGYI